MSFIYLASPYSDPSAEVRERRYDLACQVAGLLMERGHHIFSPVALGHACERHMGHPLPWEWWMEWSRSFLFLSKELWIAQIDGWQNSKGVMAEWRLAGEYGLPLKFVRFDPFEPGADLIVTPGIPYGTIANWGGVE
jgi:hypothetical protein